MPEIQKFLFTISHFRICLVCIPVIVPELELKMGHLRRPRVAGALERFSYNMTQGWVVFWRNILAFTFYLNWLWFLFKNKIITQTGILTTGSLLGTVPFYFSSLHWEPFSWLEFLKLVPNTAQPGPSLPVILLSLAWVSFLKAGEHLRAHSSLIFCPSLRFRSHSCAGPWRAVPHVAACPFP